MKYIDANRAVLGVEPICEVLQVAPSTYYAAVKREPCRRKIEDQVLKRDLTCVYQENIFASRSVQNS